MSLANFCLPSNRAIFASSLLISGTRTEKLTSSCMHTKPSQLGSPYNHRCRVELIRTQRFPFGHWRSIASNHLSQVVTRCTPTYGLFILAVPWRNLDRRRRTRSRYRKNSTKRHCLGTWQGLECKDKKRWFFRCIGFQRHSTFIPGRKSPSGNNRLQYLGYGAKQTE